MQTKQPPAINKYSTAFHYTATDRQTHASSVYITPTFRCVN